MKLSRLFISILFVLSLVLGGFASADELDGLETLTLEDFGDELTLEEDANGFDLDIEAEEGDLTLDFEDEGFDLDIEAEEGDLNLDFEDDGFDLDIESDDDFGLFEDQKVSVTLDETTETSVELSFDKVDEYSDYKVLYAKTPLFEANIEDVLETTATIAEGEVEGTITLEDLDPQTTYYVVVVALDDSGVRNDDTMSEEVNVFTENVAAAASEENMIMEVSHVVNNLTADVNFEAGKDVVTVMVYVSDSATDFTAKEVEVDASTGTYSFSVEDYTTKYVRLVPVNNEGVAGEIPDVEVVVFEEPAVSMGTPDTGPALNLAILMAMLISGAYVFRRRRA